MDRVSKYGRHPRPPHERVLERITFTETGCWEFSGALARGYGRVTVGNVADGSRRQRYAHAVVYEALVGPIPTGTEPDHLCRNSLCVNPKHIECVTHRENVLRGAAPSALAASRNRCIRGHLYDAANTHIYRGARRCRRCGREGAKRRYHERAMQQ